MIHKQWLLARGNWTIWVGHFAQTEPNHTCSGVSSISFQNFPYQLVLVRILKNEPIPRKPTKRTELKSLTPTGSLI